jgi:molybdopterin converting factor small subunit
MPTVKLFGELAELSSMREISCIAADTDSLKIFLFQHFPELKGRVFMLAVNRRIVTENLLLADMDEVAIMPPFSGG